MDLRTLRPMVPLAFRGIYDGVIAWMDRTEARTEALERVAHRHPADTAAPPLRFIERDDGQGRRFRILQVRERGEWCDVPMGEA